MSQLIDLWNVATFDNDLLATLTRETEMVRAYFETERRNFEKRGSLDPRLPYPENPYTGDYLSFWESTMIPAMNDRTIRGWHYTRLTDDEALSLKNGGIHTSDLENIRRRLNARVVAGSLSTEDADALFEASPFHNGVERRSGKFWLTSAPLPISDFGVESLLANWGGEAVYFRQRDPRLIELLQSIGRPRILELEVPVAATQQASGAATCVLQAFACSLGCPASLAYIDLYTRTSIAAESIIRIHSEGEPDFEGIGLTYPATWSVAD